MSIHSETIPCLGKSVEEILDNAFKAEKADEWRELELRPAIGKPIRLNHDNKWQEHIWDERIPLWYDEVRDDTVAHEIQHGTIDIFLVGKWMRPHIETIELHKATGRKVLF